MFTLEYLSPQTVDLRKLRNHLSKKDLHLWLQCGWKVLLGGMVENWATRKKPFDSITYCYVLRTGLGSRIFGHYRNCPELLSQEHFRIKKHHY
jgi:hypothetical protein